MESSTVDAELDPDVELIDSGSDSSSDEMLNRFSTTPKRRNSSIDEADERETTRLQPMEIDSSSLPSHSSDVDHNLSYAKRVKNYAYQPHLPPALQLMRSENVAVPLCYLLVGSLQGLSGALMNVWTIHLGLSEAQQLTVAALRSMPASFKLPFGFISDGNLLWGYRRKSYMAVGWTVCGSSMILLLLTTIAADGTPQTTLLSLLYFLFGFGLWFADVMADSVVAEKAKLEPESSRGALQSTCYACRFFALMVATPVSTVLYTNYGPNSILLLMGVLPLCILPFVKSFKEEFHPVTMSVRTQCSEIWRTVCSRSVWQPMGFVYIYNVLQVGNAAWKQYLVTVLHFSDYELNALLIAAYVLLYLGVMAYKFYFIKFSWRFIYIGSTAVNLVLSVLQIGLIQGITFGLSPFVFALGDDAFAEFVAGIQFLPTTIMMVHLCPAGSEGASYAMFTTVNNSAISMASALSTMVLGWFDVSKAALVVASDVCEGCVAGDAGTTCLLEEEDMCGTHPDGLTNLTKLSIITTLFQLSGVLFVGLLPRTRDELMNLGHNGGSRIGGGIFLFITIGSIIYSLIVGVLNIVSPGWLGES